MTTFFDRTLADWEARPRPVPNIDRATVKQAIAIRVRDAKLEGLPVGRHLRPRRRWFR